MVDCDHCGTKVYKRPCEIKKNNYCSHKCYTNGKWLKARVVSYCENCGSGFLARKQELLRGKAKCCSYKCAGLSQRGAENIKCKQCGKEFYVPPAYRDKKYTGNDKGRQYCSMGCFNETKLKYPKTIKLRQIIHARKADIKYKLKEKGIVNPPKSLLQFRYTLYKLRSKTKQHKNEKHK